MSRGPKPLRALKAAIPIAMLRGKIQMAGSGPECVCSFTIVSVLPVAFVCVKFAARILAPVAGIAAEFQETIDSLKIIAYDNAISRELWLCSKHGTLRFFRVLADGLVELGRDGRPLAG